MAGQAPGGRVVARWERATWRPVSTCGGALRPIAVCLHHQAGNGDPKAVYEARRVSAHFWLPRAGKPVQHVDTATRAWHGMDHNGYSLGVETEGCGAPPHAEPLTDYQLDTFGELMAWAARVHGIPLALSEHVRTPGLNFHRCAGGPATGCPCDTRVRARATILERARRSSGAPRPPDVSQGGKGWDEMATKDEVKQALREVLNEGTGQGQQNWAGTNKAAHTRMGDLLNKVNGAKDAGGLLITINRKVDDLLRR